MQCGLLHNLVDLIILVQKYGYLQINPLHKSVKMKVKAQKLHKSVVKRPCKVDHI